MLQQDSLSTQSVGIGVDFGTSNTAAAVFDGSKVTLVQLEADNPIMPSAVYFDRDYAVSVGEAAIAAYIAANQGRKVELSAEVIGEARTSTGQIDPETTLPSLAPSNLIYGQSFQDASMPGRLFRGIKRLLGIKSSERIMIFERPFRLVALITPILLEVRKKITATLDSTDPAHACIGHPVNFEGMEPDHNTVALQRLQEAFGHAGINTRHLFPEPNAAALSYLQMNPDQRADVILTVDFGGGTLDFCLLRRTGGEYKALVTHGIGLGGDHIDQAMFRHFLFPLLGRGERWVREVEGRQVDTLFPFESYADLLLNWTISYMLNQNEYLTPVRDMMSKGGEAAIKFERLYELITQNYSYQVFQALKQCKEELSYRTEVRLDIPEIDVDITITRAEFEQLISGQLERFEEAVSETIRRAGLGDAEIGLVLRTGGSCLIPAVSGILERRFAGKVVEHDPFTGVAAGLAIADFRKFAGN